ncbi:hypothetical protein VTN77DRAFT_743 [Rasamsonia byssochlamydoides]|uniref:uncharacterized protein n=1 Tax=Rasamsonia byssochlamydoides TaxID=89139 RepID=UPI003742DAB7
MGCCFSLFSRDHDGSSYAAGVTQERHADSSPRVINSEPTSRHHPSSTAPNEGVAHRSRSSRVRFQQQATLPLSEHYNQPIRPHVWRSKRRTWTPSQLAREREEFFDTRVTGRPEVWAALRAATSLLREGDIETAQGIIDAAGVTVPTGDLCEGCYDETGALYRLPQCIVSDPENLVPDSTTVGDHGVTKTTGFDGDGMSDRKLTMAEESEEELIPEDVERRREEKGKMSERDVIKVRARLSDRGGPDVIVTIGKTQSVGLLARKVQSEAGISDKQRVRIAYLGRMLRENEPLLNQGWKQGHVVNALVVPHPSSS